MTLCFDDLYIILVQSCSKTCWPQKKGQYLQVVVLALLFLPAMIS